MRSRPRQAAGSRTLLWLFASVWSPGVGGCLGRDLPSVVSRGSPDAATQATHPIIASFSDGQVTQEAADASPSRDLESGTIALTIGLPIDTWTGQVASLGSLTIRLRSAELAPRALTLQLDHPSAEVNLSLSNIDAGGPYTLDLTATPSVSVVCMASSPRFFVGALQTVRVWESLICSGDAGLASTLYSGSSL